MKHAKIIGTGSYLPKKVVTNDDLAHTINTSHDWIFKRTGICQRHIADDTELTSDLGAQAALHSINAAHCSAEEIDLVICATTSPDRTFPATATRIQSLIGAYNAAAFDVQAVCAGFLYALSIADQFIQSGTAKKVLVIGAETFSRLLDWKDRNTCVLFGDGAGAVVLSATHEKTGILSTYLKSDGTLNSVLQATGGPAYDKSVGVAAMNGREVYRQAIQKLCDAATQVLQNTHTSSKDLNWFVPHQANARIIDAVAAHLNMPRNKVIYTVHNHANTSSASIPLALDAAHTKFKTGDLILLDALGAGLAWGASLVKW